MKAYWDKVKESSRNYFPLIFSNYAMAVEKREGSDNRREDLFETSRESTVDLPPPQLLEEVLQ
jgi:hypothetical protein